MKRLTEFDDLADPTFSEAVIAWQRAHGRHTLPWQNTRANTRFTFPSRIAARVPFENAVMAAAVERPIPGKSASRAGSLGNTPPYSFTTRCAQACRLRARV